MLVELELRQKRSSDALAIATDDDLQAAYFFSFSLRGAAPLPDNANRHAHS